MARDEMSVRLHLKWIKVLEVVVDPFELKIVVADTRSVTRCPSCGHKTTKVHDTRDVVVRDVDFGGRATTLVWRRRRFSCERCGERHLEDHPEVSTIAAVYHHAASRGSSSALDRPGIVGDSAAWRLTRFWVSCSTGRLLSRISSPLLADKHAFATSRTGRFVRCAWVRRPRRSEQGAAPRARPAEHGRGHRGDGRCSTRPPTRRWPARGRRRCAMDLAARSARPCTAH